MISSQTAAGLVAGMLQSRNHLGPAWDSLDEKTADGLVSGWSEAIHRGKQDGRNKVMWDIENNDVLRVGWERCDASLKGSIAEVVRTIIENVN